jgi:hypothetical protein
MASGPRTHRQRHVGMHHPPFRDGVQRDALEMAVGAQPGQEIVAEDAFAGRAALAAQKGDVRVGRVGLLHPVDQPLQARVDAIAGLVRAIVGVAAEEVLELRRSLVQPQAKIELGHGELVLVG